MAGKKKIECCGLEGVFEVDSLIGIDERGQMVLPKGLREKAGIKAGDKLAVVRWQKGEDPCCITLIKAEDLSRLVKNILGPSISGITGGKNGK